MRYIQYNDYIFKLIPLELAKLATSINYYIKCNIIICKQKHIVELPKEFIGKKIVGTAGIEPARIAASDLKTDSLATRTSTQTDVITIGKFMYFKS